ncbi:MAG: hypothetical protein A3I66_19530 [Burkholderiales bacterium RIFCSPLOWO2_02_FULL_57_36]|nr:MAG: hypothetical protein A3I66_19530 [Burkholderiales bacterium RIFCSPLOWO2_02_FULL_57_36]
MPINYAVVWLDHLEADILHFSMVHLNAHVLYFNAEAAESEKAGEQAHPHAASDDRHVPDGPRYFACIAQALAEAEEIIIAGPAWENWILTTYLAQHYPGVAARVAGFEIVDYPSSKLLLACARKCKHFLKPISFC